MTIDGRVHLATRDGVAILTLDNPAARNGMSADMAEGLVAACDAIDRDPSIGAAVLVGAGGTFCSGADTRGWDPALPQAGEEAFTRASNIYGAVRRFGALGVPTVTAVRGAAVGAGLNLMLSADLRIVSETARIFAGFLRIGLHPGGGFFTLMAQRAGPETTAAVGLFGEELTGYDTARLGIAWRALPDGDVEDCARVLAARVAADPLLARRAVETMRRECGPPSIPWDVAIEMERGVQMWSQHRRLAEG